MRKAMLLVSTVLWLSIVASAAAVRPEIGATAPPLHFTQLLQAPSGTQTDWPALRGKVVVLEFWATWCGPCVASIPHLNELATAVDPATVQFISIDDNDDPKVVENFLSKRKMAGWVGIDTSGATLKAYGVGGIPMTVLVDTKGRIAAVTQPQFVTADKLLALAAGKMASFENFGGPISGETTVMTAKSNSDPLFLLELTKVPAGTKGGGIFGPKGKFVMFAVEPKGLIAFAFHVPDDRIVVKTQLTNDRYRFQGAFGDAPDSVTRPLLQAAVTAGIHIRVERKNVMRKAYVLRATPQSNKLLVPSVPNAGAMQGYWNGKIHNIGGSMDDLASSVEDAIQQPVVNETGIAGKYDAELAISDGDVAAAKSALMKVMGLELVQEQRSIPVIEVDAMPASPAKAGH